jgi:hypothetical protein
MKLICDNQETLHVASKLVVSDAEIGCHFIKWNFCTREITASFVNSVDKLVDLHNSLRGWRVVDNRHRHTYT